MRLWGYSVWSAPTDGSQPMEKHELVLVTEAPDYLKGKGWFDRRWTDLLGIERWHGDTQLEVPEWWALACSIDLVSEHGFTGTEERAYPS